MAWILRGLRDGIVTTRYPRRSDGYQNGFRGAISVVEDSLGILSEGQGFRHDINQGPSISSLCPSGAIIANEDRISVDRGKCILCGRCVEARPDIFCFESSTEVASVSRKSLVVPSCIDDDESLPSLRSELAKKVRILRRSVHVRHVDAGSDGSEESEIWALTNPVYDVQRLGVFFTVTPRHADLLLVTGVGTAGMIEPLRNTYEAMPHPKIVIAVGTDAISGGLVHPNYATGGGIGDILHVDVWVPGSPPSPFSILHGILLGIGLLAGDNEAGNNKAGDNEAGNNKVRHNRAGSDSTRDAKFGATRRDD